MAKRCLTYLCVLVGLVKLSAQPSYDLLMEPLVKDSTLYLDLYIKSNESTPFELGGSNFILGLNSNKIDPHKAKIHPGEFDIDQHPSYDKMGVGHESFLVMNVRTNAKAKTKGKPVTGEKSRLGTIEIPIENPCATISPTWVKAGDIHSYSLSSSSPNITKGAHYINPAPIDLDGGVSKTIPTISFHNGTLRSSSPTDNQWYLDGTPIPGATSSEFIPLVQGNYAVEVAYPCAKNLSTAFPVTVAGLSEFSLSYGFNVSPNPFIGETTIRYVLQQSSLIKLQLYDLSGNHLLDLASGMRPAGNHEFNFSPTSYQLTAGTYILKLIVGEKMGTVKLVALK